MNTLIKKYSVFLIGVIVLFMCLGNQVQAETISNIQTYSDSEKIWMYLNGFDGEIQEATSQIGNAAVTDVEIESVQNTEGCKIHTIILFDNSLSISGNNREKMKTVVKSLITNHDEGEIYTLATFDKEIRELSVESANYDELIGQVDAIEFVNQDTYLKNILYNVFAETETTSKYYRRFIVLSDGADDNEVGYTYNELSALLKDKNYRIYSVGSKYKNDTNALEEMFSISRAAGTSYFLLDETEEVNVIVEQIRNDNPQKVACVTIPDELKDGSEKNIQLTIKTDTEQYVLATSARMPFGDVMTSQESVPESKEPEPEATVESVSAVEEILEEPVEEEEENTIIIFIIIGVVVFISIVIIIGIIIGRKKKANKLNESICIEEKEAVDEEAEEEDDDVTVLMRQTEEDDDDSTVMMRKAETILLVPEGDYTNVLKCKCVSEITIGRKKECDICLVDDKSVSGVHCIIFYDYEGDLAIRDNSSSNGTYLNDRKLEREHKLEVGDTLEIGRTRYILQISEE